MAQLKSYVEFNAKKEKQKKEAERNGDKDGKALYKLMNIDVYGKAMVNVRNKIDVRLTSNKNGYLKWTSRPSYMLQKRLENDLVAIHKSKITLKLNKLAYVGVSMVDWSKVLMYELHYDYIKNKYGSNSRILFTIADFDL